MTNNPVSTTQKSPEHKPRPLIDLLFSIVIPSVILMKFSADSDLGATTALLLALAFCICKWQFVWKFRRLHQRTGHLDRRDVWDHQPGHPVLEVAI